MADSCNSEKAVSANSAAAVSAKSAKAASAKDVSSSCAPPARCLHQTSPIVQGVPSQSARLPSASFPPPARVRPALQARGCDSQDRRCDGEDESSPWYRKFKAAMKRIRDGRDKPATISKQKRLASRLARKGGGGSTRPRVCSGCSGQQNWAQRCRSAFRAGEGSGCSFQEKQAGQI